MFGLLENIAKAAVGVVTAPIAVVADVVTLGGVLTERKHTYTGEHVSSIVENINKAVSPD